METEKFAEILGGEYKKAMKDHHAFHAVSNLVLIATMPFDKMMLERGMSPLEILDELRTISRGTLFQMTEDGFDPFEISAKVAKENPAVFAEFQKASVKTTILDEASSEVLQ